MCSVPNAARISSARIAEATRTASAPATICASVRADKRFRKAHRFGVGERLIELGERVGTCADRAPRDRRVMPLEDAQRTDEVPDFAAPAAANLQVLAIDLLVHVDRARAGVGV